MRAVFLAAAVIALTGGVAAAAFDETTSCGAVAKLFDNDDAVGARALYQTAMRVIETLDAGYAAQGRPAILPGWDDSARRGNTALVVLNCRWDPGWDLRRAIADVYSGFRGAADDRAAAPKRRR